MNNTKLPAYPLPITNLKEGEIMDTCDYGKANGGFTKLELASLMLMQGFLSNSQYTEEGNDALVKWSIELSESVLHKVNDRTSTFAKMRDCLTEVVTNLLVDFEDDNPLKVACKAVLEETNK